MEPQVSRDLILMGSLAIDHLKSGFPAVLAVPPIFPTMDQVILSLGSA